MTDTQILGEAINKAQNNGYRLPSVGIVWDLFEAYNTKVDSTIISPIIFSHDFCKALWGNGTLDWDTGKNGESIEPTSKYEFETYYDGYLGAKYDWQVHLQQMILCEEPLRYLEKFL